jgi:hypothetical protein
LFYSLVLGRNDPGFGVALLDEDGDVPRFENDRCSAEALRRVGGRGLG